MVSDLRIAQKGFIHALSNGQHALADKCYFGQSCTLLTPVSRPSTQQEKVFNYRHNQARSLVERANKRIKIFAVVANWKRKDLDLLNQCIIVVCKLTNIFFEINEL